MRVSLRVGWTCLGLYISRTMLLFWWMYYSLHNAEGRAAPE